MTCYIHRDTMQFLPNRFQSTVCQPHVIKSKPHKEFIISILPTMFISHQNNRCDKWQNRLAYLNKQHQIFKYLPGKSSISIRDSICLFPFFSVQNLAEFEYIAVRFDFSWAPRQPAADGLHCRSWFIFISSSAVLFLCPSLQKIALH